MASNADPLQTTRHAPVVALEADPSVRDLPSAETTHNELRGPGGEGGERVPAVLGRFEVGRRLGSGGMAIVYEAIDPQLHRRVAVKLVRPRQRGSERERQRLLREAQAIARLNHPNVVTIYEVGVYEDQVFLAMEYVEGQTLRQWWNERERTRRDLLEVFVQAGRGLCAAHDAGLVHRDFKPENVLVGRDGRVRVADFGLARLGPESPSNAANEPPMLPVEGPETSAEAGGPEVATVEIAAVSEASAGSVTRVGQVVGTPRYMAPEQHLGLGVSHRSDQFAFCVALFELVCGYPPFQGETYAELASAVLLGERTELVSPDVPTWLRRVLERGLATEADERYSSMSSLIEDVEAALRYEEVRTGLARAELESARVAFSRGARAEARAKLRASLEVEDSPVGRGLWAMLEQDALVWRHDLGARLWDVRFLRDGRTLVTSGSDGSLCLVDRHTMATRVFRGGTQPALRIDVDATTGCLLSADLGGWIRVWNASGDPVAHWLANRGETYAAAFLEDGCVAVGTTTGELQRWTLEGRCEGVLARQESRVFAVERSPSGRYLAAVSSEGELSLVELASGHVERGTTGSPCAVSQRFVAWAPDERTLATTTASGRELAIYRVEEGRLLFDRQLSGHGALISSGTFGPDGNTLVTGSYDHSVRRWDLTSGASVVVGRLPTQVSGVALDPSGRYAAAVRLELALWDLERIGHEAPMEGHAAGIFSLAMAHGRREIYSSGGDGFVRRWSLETGRELAAQKLSPEPLVGVTSHPDGATVYTGGFDRVLRTCDAVSLEERAWLAGHSAGIAKIRVAADGRTIFSTGWDSTVRVWNAETQECSRVLRLPGMATELAVDPVMGRLAVSGWTGWIAIFDVECGEVTPGGQRESIAADVGSVLGLAYRPDGRALAWAGDLGRAVCMPLETRERKELVLDCGRIASAAYSHDGLAIALACADAKIRLWFPATGEVRVLEVRDAPVNAVLFTPDGRWLLGACTNGTIHAFDLETGRPVWKGIALMPESGVIVTHQGLDVFGATQRGERRVEPWLLEARSRAQRGCETDVFAFIATRDPALEVWDKRTGELARSWPGMSRPRLFVSRGLCVAHAGEELRSYTAEREGFTAIGIVAAGAGRRSTLAVTTSDELVMFDDEGGRQTLARGARGVTALWQIGDEIVLGFHDGSIETAWWKDGELPAERVPVRLEDRSSSAVTCLRPGPMGTVLIGYQNGTLGLWDVSDWKCLYRCKLHGSILDMRLGEGTLCAVTELGATLVRPYDVFELSYAEFLAKVWAEVPVTWKNGRIVEEAPPHMHPLRS